MKYREKYSEELSYIDTFWAKVIVRPRRRDKLTSIVLRRGDREMHRNILKIPHSFIVPNKDKFTHVFYWDTFFMFRGLMGTKREWLLKSMVENFIYLYKKYGIIPNFNSPGASNRSQPPLFSSMILDVYRGAKESYKGKNILRKIFVELHEDPEKWLKKAVKEAHKEYFNVWKDPYLLYYHRVPGMLLNRYGDRDIGYAHSSELESGWDFTSRFYNRCDEFLPIDLNVFLYKYERDFAKIGDTLKDKTADEWRARAEDRKTQINKSLWNGDEGFFFDYDYVRKEQSKFLSLAGFMPLWAGLATAEQAALMVKKLPVFETFHGLVITAKESLPPKIDFSNTPHDYRIAVEKLLEQKQWDYPHIWPPLEYLTVIGLLKYGFLDEAKRIMKNSLSTQSKIFREHKTFFEKIDGVTGSVAKNFHYTNQAGFGWTNAVFYRYVEILDFLNDGNNPYESTYKTPPYKLTFPH